MPLRHPGAGDACDQARVAGAVEGFAVNAPLSRRALLAAGGALVVSFSLTEGARAQTQSTPPPAAPPLPGSLATTPMLDAWIKVDAEGAVTVFTGKAELGQGVRTAFIQIAADQLGLKPSAIDLITADTGLTPNEGYTAGSHSMPDSGTAIFNAARQVRQLLVEAAAAQFGARPEQLTTSDGLVHAPDGRSLGYGPLAQSLSLHVAAQPATGLGDPKSYTLIGTSLARVDIPAKVTGGAAFIQDMRPPGMLHARVVRQPSPGAVLALLDTSAVGRMPGVVKIVRDGNYLAVVTEREWQAVKAWHALSAAAKWTETAELPDQNNVPALIRGLPSQDIEVLTWTAPAAPAVKQLQARYTKPYLTHGSIGPSCALALYSDDGLTVWSHGQGMFPLRAAIADLLRMPANKVRCIHVQGSGCYGHNGADDAGGDAALIARAVPGRPIRVQWMREQEHTAEPFSPAMVTEVSAALDAGGNIVNWDFGVWSNTHNRRPNVAGLMLQNAALPNPAPVPPPQPAPMPEGDGQRNSNPIYAFPNAHVVYHFLSDMPLRISAQRSLGAYHNVFSIESFMDELAEAAGADPVEFRLRHLQDQRGRDVIQLAADQFGWSKPKPAQPGLGRGFAFARYKNLATYCAVALELTVEHETGRVQLGRVVAAVDSGTTVNPDGVRNQIEGAIIQSASWTLYEQVTFDRRHITSADWSGYPIMRYPAVLSSVEVHIINRPGQPFLGAGEAGQGPTAAAVANAVKNATGARLRDMPLSQARIKAAIGV
jgi:nicotinate dehydrogenase subunit B